jgi:hypothetical protein
MEETKQLMDFAQQFFGIANALTAFVIIQAVALMYAFKEPKLAAAFLRWRPYTSVLSKTTTYGYIIAVIVCGVAEFWLRYAASQSGGFTNSQRYAFLGACVMAVWLRCVAIYGNGLVFLRIFVTVCREQNWLNQNQPGREFQVPRIMYERSNSEKRVHELALKVDQKLFSSPIKGHILAEDFDTWRMQAATQDTD